MTEMRRILAGAGQKLAAASSPQEIAFIALDAADELFAWDASYVASYNNESDDCEVIATYDVHDGARKVFKSGHTVSPSPVIRKVLSEGPQLILRSGDEVPATEKFGDHGKLSASLMFASMHDGDHVRGFISVQSYRRNAFTPAQLEQLQMLADYCAGALHRTYIESTRRELESRQQTFVTLGQRLAVAVTGREVAEAVVEAAEAQFGWDGCYIDLLSENGKTCDTLISYDTIDGVRQEVPELYPGLPPSESMAGKALAGKSELILRNPQSLQASGLPFGDTDRPSASLMFVPLRVGKRSIGIFSIQSYTPYAYTQKHLQLLQTLGDYCSGALERVKAEKRWRIAEERYVLITRATQDVVWDWDLQTDQLWFNENFESALGYAPNTEFTGQWWEGIIHPEDRANVLMNLQAALQGDESTYATDYRIRRADGSYVIVHGRGFIIRNSQGVADRMIGSITDISERKRYEEHLRHNAYHDALTGLPNRVAFIEAVNRALARQRRKPEYGFAVLFIDLDRFKNVNDSLGHSAGDQLLIAIAARLKQGLRPGDMVCRLGGDEFTVFLDDVTRVGDATHVAGRIQSAVVAPVPLDGTDVYVSASIGIALSKTQYKNPEEMLRDADLAMYGAKNGGRSQYKIFDPEMHTRSVRLLQMESDLRRALERGEFCLQYQPIADLQTNRLAGFEALIRWNHPTEGQISPADFIPVAEESGIIHDIGRWVLQQACAWTPKLASAGLFVSVNVSNRQFEQHGFVQEVLHLVGGSSCTAGMLKLELTESILMRNLAEGTKILSTLRAAGIEVQIDDFGTGYSCLAYLERLHLDALKIDRSFTRRVLTETGCANIVTNIISMAHSLNMKVVAEGIEEQAQIEFLRAAGCDHGQGYLISRPLDPEAAEKLSSRASVLLYSRV